jgi:hypothetical protein
MILASIRRRQLGVWRPFRYQLVSVIAERRYIREILMVILLGKAVHRSLVTLTRLEGWEGMERDVANGTCRKSVKTTIETMKGESLKLRADLAAHKTQMRELWQGDCEMLGLLKSEAYVLAREIFRLEQDLRSYRR